MKASIRLEPRRLGGVSLVMIARAVLIVAFTSALVAQAPGEKRLLDRLAQEPAFVPAYLDLAKLYYEQRQFSEAEAVLRRALAELARQRPTTGSVRNGPVPPRLRAGKDIEPPKKTYDVKPVYSSTASTGATVIADLVIGVDGKVKDAKVLRGAQSASDLTLAAMDAILQWRFAPSTREGQPVEVLMTVSLDFPPR